MQWPNLLLHFRRSHWGAESCDLIVACMVLDFDAGINNWKWAEQPDSSHAIPETILQCLVSHTTPLAWRKDLGILNIVQKLTSLINPQRACAEGYSTQLCLRVCVCYNSTCTSSDGDAPASVSIISKQCFKLARFFL